jgi:hypothetical protein
MRGARHCARCGVGANVEAVELRPSWATLEAICLRCYLGLVPLRAGDVGAGLTHPYGRVPYIAPAGDRPGEIKWTG